MVFEGTVPIYFMSSSSRSLSLISEFVDSGKGEEKGVWDVVEGVGLVRTCCGEQSALGAHAVDCLQCPHGKLHTPKESNEYSLLKQLNRTH